MFEKKKKMNEKQNQGKIIVVRVCVVRVFILTSQLAVK